MTNPKETNGFTTSVVKTLDDSLSQETFKHLNFVLNRDDRLEDIYNVKIDIIKDFISFYKKYSTLHSIRISYNDNWIDNYQGWVPAVSQIAFDSIENIKASTEYKNSNLDINNFCFKYFVDKKDEDVIPLGNTKVSFNYVLADLQNKFSYLNNEGLGEQLKKQLDSQVANPNLSNTSIHIDSRDTYGWANIRIEKDIKDFFGEDMLIALRHFELLDKINQTAAPANTIKTVKI
jgi:hypothetical protein